MEILFLKKAQFIAYLDNYVIFFFKGWMTNTGILVNEVFVLSIFFFLSQTIIGSVVMTF